MRLRTGLLAMTTWLLAGCGASTPLPEVITRAPPGNVQLVEVMRDIGAALGTRVRWGGSVVDILSEPDGATRIEILERKLAGGGRPLNHGPSDGRFAIRAAAEVSASRYSLGSEVTVAGEVSGVVESTVGGAIPLVLVEHYVRWLPPLRYYDDPLWGPGPWYRDPWYHDPWYPHYHPRSRVGIGVGVGF